MAENDKWKIAGVEVHVLLSSRTTAGRFTISEVQNSGEDGLPLHTHHYEDGFFFVLEGDFQFQLGKETIAAPSGTSIFIPRETAYAFRNGGPGKGRLLVLTVPGGVDLFIRDVGELARRASGLDWRQLSPILEKHGILPVEAPEE
ncbi:MAG: cupin domain-containing protein [Bryobacteraceae bacterium]